MTLLFANTFFPALGKLEAHEQAGAIKLINRFEKDPRHPGLHLEKLDAVKGAVHSARITRDVRAILMRDGETWAFVYADHHDDAYDWARRRSFARHPVTGALQIVEVIETVRHVEKTVEVEVEPTPAPLFEKHADDYLLSLGVPPPWLPAVRELRFDSELLVLCDRLNDDEVAERLCDLADGEVVTPPRPWPPERAVEADPSTRRRFVSVDDGGLRAALEAPLERWIAFLHPSQRSLVEGEFQGPVKATGAAGTGKTVVALHRARHLAAQGKSVLLTSFVKTLCRHNERHLRLLCQAGELERIRVSTIHSEALRVVRRAEPRLEPAGDHDVRRRLDERLRRHARGFDADFVHAEWEHVVQPHALATWPEYRAVRRTGRGRALSVRERKALWSVFEELHHDMERRGTLDWPRLCRRAEELVTSGEVDAGYDAVLVDEVQDLKAPELRFARALCRDPGGLLLVGDAGQRIYPGGYSLRELGIEVRGRSRILKVNYRTTELIRRLADRLLDAAVDDLDGGHESRPKPRSLLIGPPPELVGLASEAEEDAAAVAAIRQSLDDGRDADAIGVFARTNGRANAVLRALRDAGVASRDLKDAETTAGVGVGTMHRAKGLEFRVVLVVGCGRRVVPSPAVLERLDDPFDREQAEERERRLLYVAMTRAREELRVSWVGEPSPFLAPLLDTSSR